MKKVLVLLICLVAISCEIENINPLAPIMITAEPESIGASTATLGGRVLGEGGVPITEYGFVYSTVNPPTINDSKVVIGSGVGSFSNSYDIFENATAYFYSLYGINDVGVGYGEVFNFTTDQTAPCLSELDDFMDLGPFAIGIDNVLQQEPSGFNDGNLEFETRTGSSTLYFTLQFKETDAALPLSGSYTTVSEYNNQSLFSNGEIKLLITDFGAGSLGGGRAANGETVFIESDGITVTFTFCDIPVGANYILNGKFTYETI